MSVDRPQKILRLNYWKGNPEVAASIAIYGDPSEIRISSSNKTFINVGKKGVSLSPGLGNSVNVQGMPSSITYGGMLKELPFPISMTPSTFITPVPSYIMKPPMLDLMPTILQLTKLSSMLVIRSV